MFIKLLSCGLIKLWLLDCTLGLA